MKGCLMGKTICLMVVLMLIFVYVGDVLGGEEGMKTAFWIACGTNVFSYFFSDTLVLKQYRAQQVDSSHILYDIVRRLSSQANLPMPKVYIIPEQVPNAFATGRSPKHAAVAATQGLLDLMTKEEIEGVLAHEMSHVRHYDILIGSVASVFVGAIVMLSNTARSSSARNNNRSGLIGVALMPIAASVIQMSISRTREYKADEGSAYLTGHPEWLISALSKLEEYAKGYKMQRASTQTAHMFIINPFSGVKGNFANLFSTHPSTNDRISRLKEIQKQMS